MRIILYTGKGGVGKTCVAAATAIHLAERGKRVLVASTDAAHSLGDALDVPVGSEAAEVSENLWALEIDPVVAGRAAWGRMQEYLRLLMTSHAEGGIEADELLVFPDSKSSSPCWPFSISKTADSTTCSSSTARRRARRFRCSSIPSASDRSSRTCFR